MAIEFKASRTKVVNGDKTVFLSGSIPDPERWDGDFDALEITDAVVSLARACLTRGYAIVTAAHPTLAPLLLYVAAELPARARAQIQIYQSLLFEDVLPTATRRFEADGIGEIVWTEAVEGELPVPGKWEQSLSVMRSQMLRNTEPAAAIFIGGMDGIRDEFSLFQDTYPSKPTYAVRRPGGAAAQLDNRNSGSLEDLLASNTTYPSIWNAVLSELA